MAFEEWNFLNLLALKKIQSLIGMIFHTTDEKEVVSIDIKPFDDLSDVKDKIREVS